MSTVADLYIAYQSKLIYSCLENFNVVDVIGGYAGGQYAKDNKLWWATSIDFLYRNLKSGLIEVDSCPGDFHYENIDTLCRYYMEIGPNQSDLATSIYFCASDVLDGLVSKYVMKDWQHVNSRVNQDFMNEVEKIYARSDVGFDRPLSF